MQNNDQNYFSVQNDLETEFGFLNKMSNMTDLPNSNHLGIW